jgi:hypothetical protein
MLVVGPGKFVTVELSEFLQDEFGTATGTGTSDPAVNRLRVKAEGANSDISIEAFEA